MRFSDNYEKIFAPRSVQTIKDAAFDIIERIGMRVPDPAICRELTANNRFRLRDGRFTVSKETADSFLNGIIARVKSGQAQNTNKNTNENESVSLNANRYLDGWINNYPHSYCDPETNKIVAFDTDSLVKMTAFCNRVCRKYSFSPNVPGYPSDVPPSCQALSRFVIGSKYLDGGTYPEPMCRYSAKYLFEMCGITGRQMTSLPVYLSTPLTFGDESFYAASENKRRLKSVYVCSMPSFGASTPLSVSGGIALILAETLLAAVIVDCLTGLETYIGVSLFPFDFKDLNLVFGAPETLMLQFICHSFNNALFGRTGSPGGLEIHTHSIRPDPQAAAEKALLMAAGYMKHNSFESVTFRGMGTLGMDEIFSPAQLFIDAELLSYMRRFDAGYETDPIPDNFIDEIRGGISAGFIPSERTAGKYRDYMYHSDLFTRAKSGTQISGIHGVQGGLEERAAKRARAELSRPPEMVLEPAAASALDKLLADAVRKAL